MLEVCVLVALWEVDSTATEQSAGATAEPCSRRIGRPSQGHDHPAAGQSAEPSDGRLEEERSRTSGTRSAVTAW